VAVVFAFDQEYELYDCVVLNVTDPPSQNSVAPDAEITGVVAEPAVNEVLEVP